MTKLLRGAEPDGFGAQPFVPQHLKRWTLPPSYFGASWPEMYVFLGQHRDSDSVTRSNFQVGLERLGGESETVRVISENHWAVGWVEWIGIDYHDDGRLMLADSMAAAIADYPPLDEMRWSELTWNEAHEIWGRMTIRDRVEMIQGGSETGEHSSVFAARHDYLPASLSADQLVDGC